MEQMKRSQREVWVEDKLRRRGKTGERWRKEAGRERKRQIKRIRQSQMTDWDDSWES